MIKKDGVYVVMGLLDPDSIAFAVGQGIAAMGGKVIYTAQNERMKGIFFDRSKKLGAEDKAGLHFEYCDVTIEEQVKALFEKIGPIDGVVHSIGYANPKTALGQEVHTDAIDDLKLVGLVTGGAENRAMLVDPTGTGWIGFVDLAPGTYRLAAAGRPGARTRSRKPNNTSSSRTVPARRTDRG